MTVPVRKAGPNAGPPFSLEKIALPLAPSGIRPKIAFTGLGNLATFRQRPRHAANVLT